MKNFIIGFLQTSAVSVSAVLFSLNAKCIAVFEAPTAIGRWHSSRGIHLTWQVFFKSQFINCSFKIQFRRTGNREHVANIPSVAGLTPSVAGAKLDRDDFDRLLWIEDPARRFSPTALT
jgi:hypothetical protein